MAYEHLRLGREESITERHKRRYVPPPPPSNLRAVGSRLHRRLLTAKSRLADPERGDIGGFDDRKLLKLTLRDGGLLPNFDAIPGVQVLSQEDKSVVLVFATDAALTEVESRLATLAVDGKVTRKELLYVLQDFDHWTPQDRTGPALAEQGFPKDDSFVLDIELWPQTDDTRQRQELVDSFESWLTEEHIELLDTVRQPSLVMARVRCTRQQAERLLRHRDVRTLDLPPRTGVDVKILRTDINIFPPVSAPPAGAQKIGVLDSGITANHPLLGPAVGDAQGYLPPHREVDDGRPWWHGTFVAGLALYGNVAECVRQGRFVPELTLVSGKVFDEGNNNQTRFVENVVDEAVRAFHEQYGCRVFNFSYGDQNKVYNGRHLRGLAYTLDRLARELGVLFVVPTGNLSAADLPDDPNSTFPDYLLADSARLLDPAPALNALTVGGVALHEATWISQRNPQSIEDRPIARSGQPFPLTRSGPSINGAIKPDLVEYAGNAAVPARASSSVRTQRLGVVSLNGGFAGGHPFREDVGTSYAAPVVAHRAARLLARQPEASANMLRALLGAHARWPGASSALLNPDGKAAGRKRLLRLIGYGQVDDTALYGSLDDSVTLLAEESLTCDHHHFYEIPLAASFCSSGLRTREITVALAYSPQVRTTRLDYRATRLRFEFAQAADLEEVEQTFDAKREEKEVKERSSGRWITTADRNPGTLQVSRWTFRVKPAQNKRLFVVVTRQDAMWSAVRDEPEPYALAVVVSDRENTTAQLYAELQALLQARMRTRARARV